MKKTNHIPDFKEKTMERTILAESRNIYVCPTHGWVGNRRYVDCPDCTGELEIFVPRSSVSILWKVLDTARAALALTQQIARFSKDGEMVDPEDGSEPYEFQLQDGDDAATTLHGIIDQARTILKGQNLV